MIGLLLGRVRMWLLAAGAAILALAGVYLAGRQGAAQKARTDALEGDAKAQERMNEADIGIGAADGANIEWLRTFHDKHKR